MSEKISNPQLFFIIGRSRSGTTLLRTMLDIHPNMSIPNECTFILQLSRKYKKIKIWTPNIIEEFVHDLKSTWLFENLKIDTENLRNKLLSLTPTITFQHVCREVILQIPSSKKKQELKWIGDKNPSYSLYFKTIYSLFKNNCKYIYINRDYRDQYWSLVKAKHEIPNAVLAAKRWVNAFSLFKNISKNNTTNFHYLTYEDLVNYPERELKKICIFLNLPYDSLMLQFNNPKQLALSFTEDSLRGIHSSIKEPLTNNKIYSWKNNLNTIQIKILDKIAGRLEINTGYKPTTHIIFFKYLLISCPGYLLYWITLLSSFLIRLVPFKIYLTLSKGAFLGNIWNRYLRK